MQAAHAGYLGRMADFSHGPPYMLGVNQRRVPSMFDRLKVSLGHFRLPRIADLERDYLAASWSLDDLERRQREVEAGLFRRSAFDH
jgi:hypothetical protein